MPQTTSHRLSFIIYRLPFLILLLIFLLACQAPAEPQAAATVEETAVSPILPSTTPTLTPTLTINNSQLTIHNSPTPESTVNNPTATLPPETPTTQPTHQPTPTPDPAITINGIPFEQIIPLDDETRATVRDTFLLGQQLGRNPQRFSKVGDSVIAHAQFLTIFETQDYDLAQYNHLQPVIDHFEGSYVRYGVAIRVALRAWGVFDPLWADKDWCEPNEHMLDCEIRLNNPAYLVVRLGSNDVGSPSSFDKHMRDIVAQCLEQGIIPILGTKADRFEGDDTNNQIIRQIASDFHIPLWDFDVLADTLPNRGIIEDDTVHLTQWTEQDYSLPIAYETGHAMQNLSFLVALDAIWKTADNQ